MAGAGDRSTNKRSSDAVPAREPELTTPQNVASPAPEPSKFWTSSRLWIALDDAIMWGRDVLVFILARIVLVFVAFSEVRKQSRRPGERSTQLPERVAPEQAKFDHQHQEASSAHTDDKVKQLLTLATAVNTLVLAYASRVGVRLLLLAIATALTGTVFLCVSILGVRNAARPEFTDATNDAEQHEWARSLAVATEFSMRAHIYRVDIFRAARRWFLLAFILALVAIASARNAPPAPPVPVRVDVHVVSPPSPFAVPGGSASTGVPQQQQPSPVPSDTPSPRTDTTK
jgi:hypothetical protein